jgi:DNA-binding response OmpR family regulator
VLINVTGDPESFVRRLQANQEYAKLPVIAVLETHVNRSSGELLALGLDDVVFFPWDSEEVLARLEARLRMQCLERSLLEDQGMKAMYQTARHSVEEVEPALQAGIQWLKDIDDTFGIDGEGTHLTPARIQELENILRQVSVSVHRLQNLACARQTGPPLVSIPQRTTTAGTSGIDSWSESSQISTHS